MATFDIEISGVERKELVKDPKSASGYRWTTDSSSIRKQYMSGGDACAEAAHLIPLSKKFPGASAKLPDGRTMPLSQWATQAEAVMLEQQSPPPAAPPAPPVVEQPAAPAPAAKPA